MFLSTLSKCGQLCQSEGRRRLLSVLMRNRLPHELPIRSKSFGRQCSKNNGTAALLASSTSLPLAPPTTKITKRWHGGPKISKDAPTLTITFVLPDGSTRVETDARVGESLLQVSKRNDDIDLEGACEGVCACSTCHLILPHEVYDELDDSITEDEEDMLDMAYGLTETSRLGCQVIVTEEMDGMVVRMPKATRNFYVDGHVPQGH